MTAIRMTTTNQMMIMATAATIVTVVEIPTMINRHTA
jgi:hypothetical protein